jgi:Fe-S-cluster containining protein
MTKMEKSFKVFAGISALSQRHPQRRRLLYQTHCSLRNFQSSCAVAGATADLVGVDSSSGAAVDAVATSASKNKSDRAWFEDAANTSSLRFECTSCGKCCTGKGGKVFVNTAERSDIANVLELSQQELIQSYFVQDQGKYLIQQVKLKGDNEQQQGEQDEEERCIFLTSDKKCSIYQARPTQCRTFPFWPHILASSYDWQRTQRDCDGIRILEDNDSSDNDGGTMLDDVDNAISPIPTDTIWKKLLVHTVHRGGIEEPTSEEEDSTMTYTQMMESLPYFLDEDMLQEFQQDYLQQYHRQIVYESQDLWVVDTLGSGWQAGEQQQDFQPTRSLLFRNSPSLTQSEMAIRSDNGAPTVTTGATTVPSPWQVDHTKLLLDVHQVMARIVQLWDRKVRSFLPDNHGESSQHFAVLGTGAGALPLWLHGKYPEATIDCVEASSEVLQVAQDYFGFGSTSAETLRSYCQRGEDYLLLPSAGEGASFGPESLLDLLVVDVAAGMEIPPRLFFEADLLQNVKNRLVSPHGMVIWNIRVSSSSTLEWERMLTTLRDAFPHVHVEPVSSTNSANWIVYASNDLDFLKDPIV